MKKVYPLFDIFWDDNDIQKVTDVIRRGTFWATGPEIRQFEEKLENYFKMQHVITFNSGTSALHAVLLAYGITTGEVIVPSFSFISTANCVILAGATPVFADIEKKTLGLELNDVEKKITENTKAIIPMHYGGNICKNIEKLKKIADKYNLILIEDNAESFGAKINNKYVGTIGHASMLSFCQNKIITTGEGGAICTNDEKIHEKLLLIRSHGRVEHPGTNYFSSIDDMDYIQIGYNYRMPTICAALGISQLEKIDRIINLRRKIGKFYNDNLSNISEIEIIPELEGNINVYQLYSIILKNSKKRENLQKFLLKNGIYTKIYFNPIHLKSFYKTKYQYKEGILPTTEEISKKILALPISLRFNEKDQNYIIDKIKKYFIGNE